MCKAPDASRAMLSNVKQAVLPLGNLLIRLTFKQEGARMAPHFLRT